MNNHDFLIAVGSRVRDERHRQKMRLNKLAELTGLSDKALTSIEFGKRATDLANINRIANALSMSPYELLMFDPLTLPAPHIQVDGSKATTITFSIQITPP